MVDPGAMLEGRTRETKIRRDDAGRWFNDDERITHPLLVQAFDEWLVPAPDGSGRWALSNDINWAFVAIEGPPRFVRAVTLDEPITLHLSDRRDVPLDPATLRQGPDDALYADVGDGLVARFERHAAMQLADALDEDDRGVFLKVGERRVRPPRVDEPLKPPPEAS